MSAQILIICRFGEFKFGATSLCVPPSLLKVNSVNGNSTKQLDPAHIYSQGIKVLRTEKEKGNYGFLPYYYIASIFNVVLKTHAQRRLMLSLFFNFRN